MSDDVVDKICMVAFAFDRYDSRRAHVRELAESVQLAIASARSAVLEDAARECEAIEEEQRRAHEEQNGFTWYISRTATKCANRIRALKKTKP